MSKPARRDLFTSGNPDFLCYWSARVVSIAGSSMSFVVLPVLVYQISGSAVATGLVTGMSGISYVCVGLLAGLIADRWDRKSLMLTADWGRAALTGAIPVLHAAGHLTTTVLMIIVALNAALFVLFDAANLGALKKIVGPDRFVAANSIVWSAGTVAEIAAPGAAGLLLAATSAANLVTVDAVSFVVSALLVHAIRIPLKAPPTADHGLRTQMMAGARFIWRHRALRAATAATIGQAMAEGLVVGQLVIYAAADLGVHKGNPWLGACYGAISVGAFAASITLPAITRRWPIGALILASLTISALMLAALAVARQAIFAVPLLALWAMTYLLVFVGTATCRQQAAPDALQGRVSVLGRMVSGGAGVSAGAVLGGLITQAAGAQWSIGAGAILTAVTTAAVYRPLRAGQGALPVQGDTADALHTQPAAASPPPDGTA